MKKIHCIGVGGSGVSALAKYFMVRGVEVSGSNIVDENLKDLRFLGLEIFVGHKEGNVSDDVDLVIYSSAVPDKNPELLKAREKEIKTLSYTQTLGEIMKDSFGVAVSGTNGKTTTTAILGLMLAKGNIDPTVILGGNVREWNGNFKAGDGEVFLVEGCEYKKNMLNLRPRMIVLTNIEADHLDCYPNGIEEINDTFRKYVKALPESGVVVLNSDDENIAKVVKDIDVVKISFGIENESDLRAENIIIKNGRQEFDMIWRGDFLGKFVTNLPGKFNIYNILTATVSSLSLGVPAENIRAVIAEFRGTERRFEVFNLPNGKIVISDYAHHPTSVRETIRATKEFYNNKKILVIFQPHQKDRTIKLFDEFVKAFDDAENLILSEIYEVSGRNNASRDISANDLVKEIKERKTQLGNPVFKLGCGSVLFAKDIEETEKLIKERMNNFDVVLIMGAGDIDGVVKNLTFSNKRSRTSFI